MKKWRISITSVVVILVIGGAAYVKVKYFDPKVKFKKADQVVEELTVSSRLRDGDIIFQTSASSQSKAIQSATRSKYSHCGIVFKESNEYYVYEAVQPVKKTRLASWIARGVNGSFVVKRLKNAESVLTHDVLAEMKQLSRQFAGKNYDLTFEWSDDRMYCSEIIWKLYDRAAHISVGKLELLKDFDLSDVTVQKKLKERYGDNIPMNETVISPVSIFNDSKLRTVVSR